MTTYRIFDATSGPGTQVTDNSNYSLGVEFYVTDPGCALTEIRFWASGTVASSDHAVRLYEVASGGGSGTLVTGTSVALPSPLVSGWNVATMAVPVALTANQRYRAAVYFTTNDGYTATGSYWTSGSGSAGITDGPLAAPSNAAAEGTDQGSFIENADSMPTDSFSGGNYWIDVTVDDDPEEAPRPRPPVVVVPQPHPARRLGGATLLTAAPVEVEEGGGITGTAALPLGGLTLAATGVVKHPATAALPLGGLSLTASGDTGNEYRLWPATDGPGSQATDSTDYSMGVEFYVTSSAAVKRLHFWASTSRSGTYTGRVYKVEFVADPTGATGSTVAGTDVTFGSITSGWNTAALTTPVELEVGTSYRAVVHFTTDDGYTSTANYWSSGAGSAGIVHGPLHAPNRTDAAGSIQGGYTVGAAMAFPITQVNATNYWVDVTVAATRIATASLPLGGLTMFAHAPVTAAAALPLGRLILGSGTYADTYIDTYYDDQVNPAALPLGGLSLTASGDVYEAPPPVDPDIDGLNLSLWAVNATTGVISPLPHFTKLALSRERNALGRIAVDYPYYGRNFDLLAANVTADRDLEVEIWVSGKRAGAMRGILCDTAGDDVAEDAVWTFEGHFLELLLDEVLAWNQPATEKQELVFTTASAGSVAATLLAQAQARGGLVGVNRDFTTSLDSNGDAWASVVTVHFSPTATFLDILQELIEIGMIDGFELTGGRVLRMWNPGGQGADLTVSPPSTGTPVFRRGRNLTQSPRRHTVRNSATATLVAGADNVYEDAADASALARRGRRIEIAGSANSLSDSGSVTAYAQSLLTGAAAGTHEITHGIVFGDGHPRPLIDFFGGDWVWSDTRGDLERLRVWQLELEYGVDGYAGTVVLNTPITDRMVALARKLKRMSSGTAVVGTSVVSPEVDDGKLPAQVLGVTAASAAYFGNDGITWASVQAGWTAVTTNADASAADDIVGYFPAYRYGAGQSLSTDWQVLPQVPTSPTDWSGVVPGKTIGVRVAAVDKFGHVGAWSTEYTLTSGADATPPPTPSTPVVDSYLGILTIAWDGLGSAAETQPVDFDRVDVHVSTSSGFTPSGATKIDSLRRKGTIPWDGGTYGVTYYGKLIAYDKTGNASAASAQDSAALVQAGDGDISAMSIGKLTAGIMSAIMTLSGIIRTASSGDRVEIDSDGIHCYDGSTLVFDFDLSAGTVYVRGTVEAYQSSTDRIVIQPSGSGASGASLSEISFYAGATSPGYINGFPTGSARTGLGLNSGNSADSGTTRHQSTLRLFPTSWNLFVNTAPGDTVGPNVARGGEVIGSTSSVALVMHSSTDGAELSRILAGPDAIDLWLNDGDDTRDGGFIWLRRGDATTYFGNYVDGSIDAHLRFQADAEVTLRRNSEQYLKFADDNTIRLRRSSSSNLTLDSTTTELLHASGIRLTMDSSTTILGQAGNTYIQLSNSGNILFQDASATYSSVSALKSFVIDHPTDPDRLLVHGCTESPQAGVEYWGEVDIRGGAAVVELPAYFEAATRPDGRQVQLTPVDELCLVAASPIVDGRFTVRCSGPDGTKVAWLVKAVRADVAPFDPEPLRADVEVRGTGPYRYIQPRGSENA